MLKKEVGGTKQPSFHSLLNALLPHLLQVNHMLLLPLFCLMWDADRLGKALTRGTACYQTARTTSSENKKPNPRLTKGYVAATYTSHLIYICPP